MRVGRRKAWTVLVALLIGALTIVYRFTTLGGALGGFDNDHFFQIVRADAMLDGEWPLRDYADAELRSLWPPLTYATSAAAMHIMGRSLWSEAMMSVAMLGFGAAALCWTAARVAGAIAPAALLTLLAVALSPTLYNYPKIVPYALAVIAMLAYARQPAVWRLALLAATVVLATLYRHDHAVYLGIATLVLLLGVHGRDTARPLLQFCLFVFLGLGPGLVYAQQHGGVVAYLRECLLTSQREAGRTTDASSGFTFEIDPAQPWLAPMPDPPPPPARIGVRWAATLTATDRARAEGDLGLAEPDPGDDPQRWTYVVREPATDRLAAIVRDPRVADTSGVDRQTFALTTTPAPPPRGGVFGWRVAPGVLREVNATPWLLVMAWAVVLTPLVFVLSRPVRDAAADGFVPPAFLAAVSALGIMLCLVFLRTPAPHRLPDVTVPVVVLGSWLMTALPRAVHRRSRAVRAAVATLIVTAVVLSVVSVGAVGTVPAQIVGTGAADGITGVQDRWRTVSENLGNLPESTTGIDAALGAAARYLRRCTAPTDRLLVADNFPEVHYFARRGVAAGQLVYFGGFYTWEEAQHAALDRWRRQPVPLVLAPAGERFEEEFVGNYPRLAEYLRARYRRAGRLEIRTGAELDVWADAHVTTRPDAETGLPCVSS